MKKFLLILLTVSALLSTASCKKKEDDSEATSGNASEVTSDVSVDENTPADRTESEIVTPTEAELDLGNIADNLSTPLMWHFEYDSAASPEVSYNRGSDNMLYLFEFDTGSLDFGNSKSGAIPLNSADSALFLQKEEFFENQEDPKKIFFDYSEFEEGELNSDGSVKEEIYILCCPNGYYRLPQTEMEWLIEDVWNISLDTIPETTMYLHEGYYYYDSRNATSDAPYMADEIKFISIEAAQDGFYTLSYQLDFGGRVEEAKATVALKENENGYRYWSVYKTELV